MLRFMKNKVCIYAILAVFCLFGNLQAGPVITMFMEPYPLLPHSKEAEKLVKGLKKPGKIAKMKLKALNQSPLIKGIFSTYGGYLGMSDNDGQTSFPKKHVLPIIYLLITNRMTPVMMAGNTIHHWEIEPDTQAKMYKLERMQDEMEEFYYWEVQKVPLPADNRIPLESITILAKPDTIYVPEGTSITQEVPNLILPTIFVKKGIKINSNALYMLNIRQFFGQIRPIHEKGTIRYLSTLPK